MKRGWKRVIWSPEEDEIVRQIWSSDQTMKSQSHRLPIRSLGAIPQRAWVLKLGKRPVTLRGRPTSAWTFIERELAHGPLSNTRLMEATHLSRSAICATMKARHLAGEVHVAAWIRRTGHGGKPAEVWALGRGVDAPYPVVNAPRMRAPRFNPFAALARLAA